VAGDIRKLAGDQIIQGLGGTASPLDFTLREMGSTIRRL